MIGNSKWTAVGRGLGSPWLTQPALCSHGTDSNPEGRHTACGRAQVLETCHGALGESHWLQWGSRPGPPAVGLPAATHEGTLPGCDCSFHASSAELAEAAWAGRGRAAPGARQTRPPATSQPVCPGLSRRAHGGWRLPGSLTPVSGCG